MRDEDIWGEEPQRMSERRCERCDFPLDASTDVCESCGKENEAPSCDSELEAIKKRVGFSCTDALCHGTRDRNTLLRKVDELRVKLAEAEKTIRDLNSEGLSWKYRAEAAEARVRELELSIKLIASGNGNIRTEQNR